MEAHLVKTDSGAVEIKYTGTPEILFGTFHTKPGELDILQKIKELPDGSEIKITVPE